MVDRWCWSGALTFPVGDPFDFTCPGPEADPPYRANRGLLGKRGSRHAGVDLSNRQGGGNVRAAAHGLVVLVAAAGGYGEHVVLAHRRIDESTVFTVYAHLESGSTAVRAGEPVAAGTVLGRVGDTGRATSPHLHFELRTPEQPDQRWEKARAHDPVEFVRARLPAARSDSSWAGPYRVWAERAGLIDGTRVNERSLTRATWWRVLAGATRRGELRLDAPPETLRAGLLRDGFEAGGEPHRTPPWSELVRDLDRLRETGSRLPEAPVDALARAQDARRELRIASPARELYALGRLEGEPSVAAVCLVLADLAGPPAGPSTAQRASPR